MGTMRDTASRNQNAALRDHQQAREENALRRGEQVYELERRTHAHRNLARAERLLALVELSEWAGEPVHAITA